MKNRRRFQPGVSDGLEVRMMPSLASITPVAVHNVNSTAHTRPSQAVADHINQSFDSFTQDYLQAQGVYLTNPSQAASSAFKSYVRQRVQLLASQLTRTFVHAPGSLNVLPPSAGAGPTVTQALLRKHISGNTRSSLLTALVGSRSGTAGSAFPPSGTSGTVATLYTDQAVTAIETARSWTLNSAGFLYGQKFVNGRPN